MSTTVRPSPAPPDASTGRSIHQPTLPRWAPLALLGAGLAVGALVSGFGLVATPVIGGLIYLVGIYLLSRFVESGRRATDRLVTGIVASMFAVAMVPLVSVIWTVVSKGAQAMNATFFTYNMRNVVGDTPGGIQHAIWGTLIITALATLISVPIGIFTSIYLVEYGTGRLPQQIRFLVDVMTGIPSIVAGLFAYAMFELFFGAGVRMGVGGAVALSVLMIPVVVRSSEEMLKLVPNELREAAYALGVPKWRTITKVVLPTALAGIATGVTLAIARVIGETAPLLVIAGITDSTNLNPVDGRMATLPVFAYYQYTQPGIPPEFAIDRAWGAALALMIIVLVLNLVARLISYAFSPQKA
uniref:Phosphate transport system permease protein PstA n=1 Tax=uncultured Nocardioidaceae bacterium TaxID=253824 RepID=A0A6J4KMS7_9ACTN|nr:MAG: Phosphate transport system permease protein PstA [uncultured Nocardioidaceae bacterium]